MKLAPWMAPTRCERRLLVHLHAFWHWVPLCQPSVIKPQSESKRPTKALQLPIHPEMFYSEQDFGDFINGSTFEVDAMNYQEWPTSGYGDEAFGALQFYQTPANTEAIPVRNWSEPQSNLSVNEVSTARFRDSSAY